MKIWQSFMLTAAVLVAPHLSREFAFGATAAYIVAALWAASRGD